MESKSQVRVKIKNTGWDVHQMHRQNKAKLKHYEKTIAKFNLILPQALS